MSNNKYPYRPLELLSVQEREELSQPGNDDPNKEVSIEDLLPVIDISDGLTNRVKKIQAGQLMARLAEGTFADVDLSNINQEEAISNLGRLDDALVSMDGETEAYTLSYQLSRHQSGANLTLSNLSNNELALDNIGAVSRNSNLSDVSDPDAALSNINGLNVNNNLSDLSDVSVARTNLELGTAAQSDTGDFATAAQGSLADTAAQPSDLTALEQSVNMYTDTAIDDLNYDEAGSAAAALLDANDYTDQQIAAIPLGTAASEDVEAFDPAGSAAAVQSNLNTLENSLGTAAYENTTAFDSAGSAASAESNANSYTDQEILALNLGTAAQADTTAFDSAGSASAVQSNLNTLENSLGTAAYADTTQFATAAQGSLADSSLQPGDLDDTITYLEGYVDAEIDSLLLGTASQSNVEDFDPAGSASQVASDLLGHEQDTNNPHSVTANQVGAPPTSRAINTGTGLTGGGDLSANRTLSLTSSVQSSLSLADTAVQPVALSNYVPFSNGSDTQISYTGDGGITFRTLNNPGPHIFSVISSGGWPRFTVVHGADELRGDPSGWTIGGNAVWHEGNDGDGSGLDADLLDGMHASDFATSAQGSLADTAVQPEDILNLLVFDTLSDVQSANIDPSVNVIEVYGHTVAGIGGGRYVRVAIQPDHQGRVQSLDGAWWELLSYTPNVLMFGGIDGQNSQTAIVNMIEYAIEKNTDVYWPDGNYTSTANISNFHNVKHHGYGSITRGSDTFYPDPKSTDSNTIYVDDTGSSDNNDGFTSSQPLSSLGAVFNILSNYGPKLDGTWTIQVAAGNYSGGIETPIDLIQNDYIYLVGPNVGSPNVPTAVIEYTEDTEQTVGLHVRYSGRLSIHDILINGAFDYAMSISRHSDVLVQNLHVENFVEDDIHEY